MADTCKSCGASIRWAITPNGKRMPLDDQRVLVAEVQGEDIVRMVHGYISHFATCQNAAQHRSPTKRVGDHLP